MMRLSSLRIIDAPVHGGGCPVCGGEALVSYEVLPAEDSTNTPERVNMLGYVCENGCILNEQAAIMVSEDHWREERERRLP